MDDFTPDDLLKAMIECATHSYEHQVELYDDLKIERRSGNRKRAAIYRSRHPHIIRARSVNRRGKRIKTNGLSRYIIKLYELQEGRCGYCGIPVFWDIQKDAHVDHVLPMTKGGSNLPDNIVIACSVCNHQKKDKTLEQWKLSRGW